jgi:Uma2 family endonuclease
MLPLPTPRIDHQEVSFLLTAWLRAHAPRDRWRAVPAVGVAMATDHSFEPDVLLVDAGVDPARHYLEPEQVTLVVEIVSPGTRRRDRIEKPADYAAAGIRHYWRVELDPVHVYAYRLTPEGSYRLAADSAELLELAEPFPVKLPISELAP